MITGLGEAAASALAKEHVCACGSNIIVCWGGSFGVLDYIVRCLKDIQHQTIRKKESNVRHLVNARGEWEPFDMTTQQPVNQTLARILPTTEAGMLERVDQAAKLVRFDRDMTPEQRRGLAIVALAYGLDPLMGELILYQGKPMITIKGRRRKDEEAGHHPDIDFRFLTAEEKEEYQAADAWQPGDLGGYCILKTEWGNTVRGFGKVTKREREAKSTNPNARDSRRSPIVDDNPIEMWQKRAEDRARNMGYGPLPRPMLTVGFDVIEGEGRLLDDEPALAPPAQRPAATPSRVPPAGGAQAPKAPQAAQRPARAQRQGVVCTIHDVRMAQHPTEGLVHRLEDGAWCNGQPGKQSGQGTGSTESFRSSGTGNERDDVDTDTGEITNPPGDAPADFPASVAQDLEGLQAAVKAKGMEWAYFELNILRMSWSEWLKRGHTVAEAMRLLSPGQGR